MEQTHKKVEAVFSDGGVIQVNPSPVGGMWAFAHVTDDQVIRSWSGFITPAEICLDAVSNNVTEFYALLRGLEELPPDWTGVVYTDSWVTLCRFKNPRKASMKGIPDLWRQRAVDAVDRFYKELPPKFVLLGGHPTKAELASGARKKDGLPVSKHNVFCDKLCTQTGKEYVDGLNGSVG